MFEAVARANIHHKQIIKLLKQRKKIHASLVYQQHRMATLEQSLCASTYALLDANQEGFKPEVAELVLALSVLVDDKLTSEILIASYTLQNCVAQADEHHSLAGEATTDSVATESIVTEAGQAVAEPLAVEPEALAAKQEGLAQAIELLCSLLPAKYLENKLALTFDNSYLEETFYRNSQLLDLLAHFSFEWPIEPLQVIRQAALTEQFTPSLTFACLLFGQDNVTSQELAQGYKHPQIAIAKASFVKGLRVDNSNAKAALFSRFSKTTTLDDKADLLVLAGMSGDERWIEPCTLFCKDYPEYTFTVLSNFQHKIFLPLIIELMALAPTSEAAYQAWLLLTNTKLLSKPQLQDNNNKHKKAGKLKLPNIDQAELHRQALMQQAGAKVLNGILFDDNDATEKLTGLQGKAVQHALLPAYVMTNGMPLYCRQLSSIALRELILTAKQHKAANCIVNNDIHSALSKAVKAPQRVTNVA